jgi:FtsP/CotA-like multicopper oxidase with cupredoxin domain
MRAKSWRRSLVLLVSAALAAVAVQAQDPLCKPQPEPASPPSPPMCEPLPSALPWGQVLHEERLPAIDPVGDELNTSLVIRERDAWVPVFTASLCQANGKFTYQACSTAGSPALPPCANGSTCVSATTCSDTGLPCDPTASPSDCSKSAACVSAWGWQCEHLRLYGSPKDPDKPINPANPHDPNLRWGYPGPILHARARTLADPTQPPVPANPTVKEGTRIKIKLYNYLKPADYMEAMKCNPATYQSCSDPSGNEQLYCVDSSGAFGKSCTVPSDCSPGDACLPMNCTEATSTNCPAGTMCQARKVHQESPNCFHGDRVTNLHLHGTHTSPQAPQDNILLNLYPVCSTGVPTGPLHPNNAVGSYQMDVNPLPWNQAPGTHWYHPHKHGATSIQVQTGMGGALIVRGAFDDWLDKFYKGQLVDRVLAVQQISGENQFFIPAALNFAPTPLVDGYAAPIIKMRPGEIQRFRFVSATTQNAPTIAFDSRITMRQIAQDGIQFAEENFYRQPLSCNGLYNNYLLAPGSRADFLVQAPVQTGDYTVSATFPVPEAAQQMRKRLNREPFVEPAAATAVPTGAPPFVTPGGTNVLFTIQVGASPKRMSFPMTKASDPGLCSRIPKPTSCWPDTPYFLQDLPRPAPPPIQLAFSMNGNNAAQPNSFWISTPQLRAQYQPCCAALTTPLGETVDWSIATVQGVNNSASGITQHVFHIHTNPFQVLRIPTNNCSPCTNPPCPAITFKPPYFWQDSLNVPTPGTAQPNDVAIRQRFDDYTGAYVLHCHILGHEDRGMMWNVQTVCPRSLQFGATQLDGGPDNCLIAAPGVLPMCSPATQCPAMSSSPVASAVHGDLPRSSAGEPH